MTEKRRPTRVQHLAAIHIAEKALLLTREDAAALKLQVTGKASSADMDERQRSQYLAHLAVLQAKAAEARGEKAAYNPTRPALVRNLDDSHDQQWSKARALWHNLAAAGEVRTDTDAALQTYATRQTKVSAWRFMRQDQITKVIEALKAWCIRCNVATERV